MEDAEMNYANLTRNPIISKYLINVNKLKQFAAESCQISNRQFDNYLFLQYFSQNNWRNSTNFYVNSSLKDEIVKQIIDRKRKILFWIFYLVIACLFLTYKNEASTLVLRNIQTFIYPGMKLWRKMTLPVISKFPGLTELYDESCLMMNPFFQVDDLNCEPCAGVVNVLDLTHVQQRTEFVPFIFKINQQPVYVSDLFELYKSNKDVFYRDAYRVTSTNREVTNLDELFHDFNRTHQVKSHNLWRCNRMPPARTLRTLFARPNRLPTTGIALERYLAIDTDDAPSYPIPDAECSNMFIQQALGTRIIILRPTTECRSKCRTISIRLPQSFVLSYNWWYWRPISAPDQFSKSTSISFIGSYC
uniref:Putative conserved plasma membrane protein n=1 Tax=Tabanus bromius TaxID=304241 RepID=A0A0K8TKR0_TABBR